jgi:hypothetical protein
LTQHRENHRLRHGLAEQINGSMFPAIARCQRILIKAGITTLKRGRSVPKTLTLAETATAHGADLANVLEKLGYFFEARRTRTSRASD